MRRRPLGSGGRAQGAGGVQAQRSAGVLSRRHGRSRAAIGVVKVSLAQHAADLSHDRGRVHGVAGDVPHRQRQRKHRFQNPGASASR